MIVFVSTATASAPGRSEREGVGAGAGQRRAALPGGRGHQPQGKGWLVNHLNFYMHALIMLFEKVIVGMQL